MQYASNNNLYTLIKHLYLMHTVCILKIKGSLTHQLRLNSSDYVDMPYNFLATVQKLFTIAFFWICM